MPPKLIILLQQIVSFQQNFFNIRWNTLESFQLLCTQVRFYFIVAICIRYGLRGNSKGTEISALEHRFQFIETYKSKLEKAKLSPEDYRQYLTELESGIMGYTYLEE